MWWIPLAVAGAQSHNQILGSLLDKESSSTAREQRAMFDAQRMDQYYWNTMGIQHRVEDARRAGLHPLATLGAQPAPSQAFPVGDLSTKTRRKGDLLRGLGQDLTRAMSAMLNKDQRALSKLAVLQEHEKLKGMRLGNQVTLKKLQEIGSTPGMPGRDMFGLEGQGDTGKGVEVIVQPSVKTASGNLGFDAGVGGMEQWVVDKFGNIHGTLNQQTQEALENDFYLKTKYFGSKVLHHLRGLYPDKRYRDKLRKMKPKGKVPPGKVIRWAYKRGNWVVVKDDGLKSIIHPPVGLKHFRRAKPYRKVPRYPKGDHFKESW